MPGPGRGARPDLWLQLLAKMGHGSVLVFNQSLSSMVDWDGGKQVVIRDG